MMNAVPQQNCSEQIKGKKQKNMWKKQTYDKGNSLKSEHFLLGYHFLVND